MSAPVNPDSNRRRVLAALPGCVEVIMRRTELTSRQVSDCLSDLKREGLAKAGLVTPSGRYWRAVKP